MQTADIIIIGGGIAGISAAAELAADASVVVISTGNGLKDVASALKSLASLSHVRPAVILMVHQAVM